MNKYDKMITVNKKKSEEKIASARRAIYELMEEQERVTVPKLMKLTGLSRGFFYKNAAVRNEMDKAIERQAGLVDPRRKILDMAMENKVEQLEKQIWELKKENEELKKKNKKLQQSMEKKELDLIRNL